MSYTKGRDRVEYKPENEEDVHIEVLTVGKIYDVIDIDIERDRVQVYGDKGTLNWYMLHRFNYLPYISSTVKLVTPDLASNPEDQIATIVNIPELNKTYNLSRGVDQMSLRVYKGENLEHDIRWGSKFGTVLADVKPILDCIEVEIVAKPKKYIIDATREYTEEEVRRLASCIGITFKLID